MKEANGRATLMVVGPKDDREAIRSILGNQNYQVVGAASFIEAEKQLMRRTVSLILSERDLPDGSRWQDVLNKAETVAGQPRVIVFSRLADDRLWAEALNLGCYDVLAKPFDHTEVTRVVAYACGTGQTIGPPKARAAG